MRCAICRFRLKSPRNLVQHYITRHSRKTIIKHFIQNTTPKLKTKKRFRSLQATTLDFTFEQNSQDSTEQYCITLSRRNSAEIQVTRVFPKLLNEHTGFFEPPLIRHCFHVYVCTMCLEEFPSKKLLTSHIEWHAEENLLEQILEMERDYPTLPLRFWWSNFAGLLAFLYEPCDFLFQHFLQTTCFCRICRHDIPVGDFEQHLAGHFAF